MVKTITKIDVEYTCGKIDTILAYDEVEKAIYVDELINKDDVKEFEVVEYEVIRKRKYEKIQTITLEEYYKTL